MGRTKFPEEYKRKLQQSMYRSGQALRVPEGRYSKISRQSTYKGGKVVILTHRPHLPPPPPPKEIFLVIISLRG